jgi:hypothetical protein
LTRLRRIALLIASTVGILALGAFWIAPVALSINTARTAPEAAGLVPIDLPDRSISPTPGSKLSYLGYEFEIPWTDLDDTQTKRYPDQVILTFRSGRRLMMGVSLPKFWITNLGKLNLSPAIATVHFGPDALQSDYRFLETLYDFTPDKMHAFAIRPSTHYREAYLLTLKSAALSRQARSGFFKHRRLCLQRLSTGGSRRAVERLARALRG